MSSPATASVALSQQQAVKASGRFYRPELDVLRLIAFLTVLLHHGPRQNHTDTGHHFLLLAQQSGGFGLSIFFFLSAYLITELLLLEKERTGSIHMKAFYARRMLRIWPLYIGFILFCYLLGKILGAPYWISIGTVAAYLLFAGNWVVYPQPNPIGPLWSISVEEQFYLIWPWLVKFTRRHTLGWISAGVILLSFSVITYLAKTGAEPNSVIWENSLTEFLFFGTGTLMALWWGTRKPNLPAFLRLTLAGGSVFFFLFAEHLGKLKEVGAYPAAWRVSTGYGLVDIGCILLFSAFLGCPARWLPQPAIYLGKISYGLYVFHDLCLEIAKHLLPTRIGWTYPVALILAIAFAIPSYHFFEKPFLKWKSRFQWISNRVD